MQKTKHLPGSEKWQQLLEMWKMQRISYEDYRRNQQKNQQRNQQEVTERNPQEQQNRTRNSKQYTKQLWD